MAWLETASDTFVARHDERDADDAAAVLTQLERTRQLLERLFPERVGPLAVVLHGSRAQLDLAVPWLPLQRRQTGPAARRYLVGWASEDTLHVLAPRVLAKRASNVEGSLELSMLAPAALLTRRIVAANNPGVPPPFGPRSFARFMRWAWLVEGAAQYFSGQVAHVRPAVTRRLREGGQPSFPPGRADAAVLGGTVYDLLAREEGQRACVRLAQADLKAGPARALEEAFPARPLRHTEAAWRAHLTRLAAGDPVRPEARRPPRRPRRSA